MDTVPAAEVLDLLAAIRDALGPPAAATYEGLARRDSLLAGRAAYLAGALGQAVESGHVPGAAFIRRLAESPLGYEPEPGGSEGK